MMMWFWGDQQQFPLAAFLTLTCHDTGSSVKQAALGKVNLRAKTITEGAGSRLPTSKSFTTFPNEALKKTFTCYPSTSTALSQAPSTSRTSTLHAAAIAPYHSPLRFLRTDLLELLKGHGAVRKDLRGESSGNKGEPIGEVHPDRDGHDFWFMGFVNHEKASRHLTESISGFVMPGVAVNPTPPAP
ncbi:hypothetical protein MLD38_024564 [Melastoma candidum]|uniref:Uncharacterized protein n=1 Tax=Melastoma candidum TaxID=119954 RepID=A0ACB9NVC7_9MYRT|nr:hypothetical protein MLD38_024564 [Melastoma candidum]